ncbi:zeta-carotene desaturase, chloroplastic/chromoplastic [Panicum miliaceum]|uniref:Zeta-carotene desaturase, chloroplastic/chromoplastic n=1 Tax=Panicum miliaceum TaxID=4540 RepID=A0A3L6QVI6_PANMI|nr:zeta-carotene desaturase, chloroplastic/chromoplastic [Panicum miliaceum]
MASVAATSTLAPALAARRRRARPGAAPLPLPPRRAAVVRCSLESNVSDMGVNAPKGLFPPEPEHYRGPKLKVAIIGAGLAGMSTAVELLDQGHEVDLYESRPFIGGKVGSFVDRKGNHIEMGLHVFFGCYSNLFRLMKKVGADNNLLVKEHTHTFVNKGGAVGELDFRFPVGAPLHGIQAFLRTNQLKVYDKARNAVALALSPVVRALVDPDGALQQVRDLDDVSFSDWFMSKGGTRESITRMWDPVAYALGFIDCDNISARCMLTIFTLFATKTEASLLRMLKGSPDVYLSGPIKKYITDRGGRFHLRWGCREVLYEKAPDGETYVKGLFLSKATSREIIKADAYVAACDVPGIKRLLPSEWREWEIFDNIYKLDGVPVVTVQLRYNGWVTELQDLEKSRQLEKAVGLDNLLYTPDADFSCFSDLALSSPADYYIEGQGSLIQAVLTPGDPYMPLPNEQIISKVQKQVVELFPSARGLEVTWSSVVKIGQSLYREAPGNDPFRPDQKTPVKNFFLSGSYTKQDYIDSMEGATLSGRRTAAYICGAGEELLALRKKLVIDDSEKALGNVQVLQTTPRRLAAVLETETCPAAVLETERSVSGVLAAVTGDDWRQPERVAVKASRPPVVCETLTATRERELLRLFVSLTKPRGSWWLMAPSPAAGPPPARPSSSHLWRAAGVLQSISRSQVLLHGPRRRHRRLPGGVVRAAPDAPPVVRAAVSAVTELLRALSPNKTPRDAAEQGEAEDPPPCGSVEDVLAVLRDDYRRAYFLTGLSRYSQNLDLLVPFFNSPSLELESIEKGLRVETKFVKATWKLRTYLRLPWRPLIAIRGNTTYDLNEDYKVVRHSESWDVSALEAIGQIFVSAREQRKGSRG